MNKAWPTVRLDQVVKQVWREEQIHPEKQYNVLGVRWYGGGLFVKDTKFGHQIKADRAYRVEVGDFVYNRLFAWKGSFAVADAEAKNCYVSNEFPCFNVDRDRLDSKFLLSFFRRESAWNEALGLSAGATPTSRNRLKEAQFLNLKIPLPPLAEQRRIVARIEELAGKINMAAILRSTARQELEALAHQSAAELFPPTSSGKVADKIKFQTGYAFKSDWFSDSGIRLARNANVGHGALDWSETVRLPESRRKEFPRFELQSGDILISLDRPIISTGVKVARVRDEDVPALLLQRVARPLFKDDSILPEYFFSWLRSPHFITAIDPGRSNGVPHISHKDIERVPFAAPPIEEQHRIVAELNALQGEVDALKRLQAETAAELDALLPSILDKAFKGEL